MRKSARTDCFLHFANLPFEERRARPRLSPEALVKKSGLRQVFWLVSSRCAFPGEQWHCALDCFETYSSGDCPGFAPVFPFKPASQHEYLIPIG
jgi:hypothetical protein